ncbi:LysM peptidoglycan-binding domain-containing protein [Curtobacterium sp. RRHDQ10]|uniref:LysM peptidoglycan-binding domain-containing protein n=1 Tax=Curtobacterium phyllosphaerae TaxID=3413379 RepID=UPI003BEFEB53
MDTPDDAVRRARAARFATVPIVIAGTIAAAAGLTGPIAAHADQRHPDEHRRQDDRDRGDTGPDRVVGARGPVFGTAVARNVSTVVATPVAAVAPAPATYTVVQGDTVSAIAARFGLGTRDVLAANGLGWNAIIHPGQTLRLGNGSARVATVAAVGPTAGASTGGYHVVTGDTASAIAARLGVPTSALLAANQLSSSSVIYPGQTLRVPAANAPATASPATTSPVAASPAAPSPAASRTVTIATGDTLATIAAAHQVTVTALLAANGLTYTSTIYAGKTLVLPSTSTTGLTNEMRANAATIVAVGRSLGVPDRGLVIALAAAMQESGLRNLDHGDRDSVGVFQQRPSQGWGTDAQLMDVPHATRLFFGGRSNPNRGVTAGLLDVPNWQGMSVTQAAQSVQYSAFPDAYAQWEKPATGWLATL